MFNMCAAFTLAQTSTKNAIDEISKASGNISTLQADFTQTKKMKMLSNAMTSKGKMWCTQPNLLRWEYLTPNTSAFILNNGKVLLKGGKRNHTINVNRNRMLRELTRLMRPASAATRTQTSSSTPSSSQGVNGDVWLKTVS